MLVNFTPSCHTGAEASLSKHLLVSFQVLLGLWHAQSTTFRCIYATNSKGNLRTTAVTHSKNCRKSNEISSRCANAVVVVCEAKGTIESITGILSAICFKLDGGI